MNVFPSATELNLNVLVEVLNGTEYSAQVMIGRSYNGTMTILSNSVAKTGEEKKNTTTHQVERDQWKHTLKN